MLLYTVGVGGAAYVYLRLFRGWRLSDLMYVTRSSLTRSMSSVTAGEERRPTPYPTPTPQSPEALVAFSSCRDGLWPSLLLYTCHSEELLMREGLSQDACQLSSRGQHLPYLRWLLTQS